MGLFFSKSQKDINSLSCSMTSSCIDICKEINTGIDSSPRCDKLIHDIVFQPPIPFPDEIKLLDNGKNISILSTETKSGINVCILEIIPQNINSDKCIIYSHGNGEDILTCASYLNKLSYDLSIRCITYDYPGYGLTSGIANEHSCYECHEAVISYVINHFG